jgi:ABC-type transporter Mla maintaining outer membrane lipid asymmetry permease subunit MlaE
VLRGTPRAETALWIVVAVAASPAMIWGWSWNVVLNDYGAEAAASFSALLHGHAVRTAPPRLAGRCAAAAGVADAAALLA